MLFASDFPHNDTTWPRSQEVLDGIFEGVPDEVRVQMAAENCVNLLGLDID